MVKHYIILSSSYTDGARIALHYSFEKTMLVKVLVDAVKKIQISCGEKVSISTHYMETESVEWESIYNKDNFFKEVKVIGDIDLFIEKIKKDQVLQGLDVAKYILSMSECTYLKLEKLVYLCYAEYLCKTREKLFVDNIYANKYGPMVQSVHTKYKGTCENEFPFDEQDMDISVNLLGMPSKSRILFSHSGIEKVMAIDKIIEKYKNCSLSDLVNITCKEGTPWSLTYCIMPHSTISDEEIIKYHRYEQAEKIIVKE